MTKKTTELVNKYEDRLDTLVFLYEHHVIDFDRFHSELKREETMFEELVTSMYYYHLISENDHSELTGVSYNKRYSAYNKALEIKLSR